MPKMRLKKGDNVRVMSGRDKGIEGQVLAVFPDTNRVIVENVHIMKKSQRPTQENPRGGYVERESGIHASNVQLLDPKTGEPTRIRYEHKDDGRKVRVSVKSGVELDE